MGIWGQLLLQAILIFSNAVFACAEIAVLSVNEAKITKLEESGNKRARKLRKLTEQPAKFLSTIQVAITLSGFLGSAFAADNFATPLVDFLVSLGVDKIPRDTLQSIAIVLVTLILSYFTLILGELVPKRLAMKKSEQMSLAMAPMLLGCSKLFTPIVWFLSVSTNFVLRLLGLDPNEEDEDVSEEGIRLMVDEGGQKGVIDEQEQEIIQNVFEFNDITVGEFATHRTDVHVLWLEDDEDEWERVIHDTRHSMYPVCDDTIDNVVGILSVKDYFRLKGAPREQILEALRPAYYVPEGIHADVLMKQMKTTKNHFAVVLDEYGGLRGIVTMNDLLEQLVGDLTDNNDEAEEEEPDIVKLDTPPTEDFEGEWAIRGVASLSEVAEELNAELPTDKYDTMGGYVFSSYGVVPEDGTEFEIDLEPLHVRVTEIREHRIEKMIVRRDKIVLHDDEDTDDDEDDKKEKEKDSEKEPKEKSKNR